jgi:hypothetical protein
MVTESVSIDSSAVAVQLLTVDRILTQPIMERYSAEIHIAIPQRKDTDIHYRDGYKNDPSLSKPVTILPLENRDERNDNQQDGY